MDKKPIILMFCPSCGKQVQENSPFCQFCGKPLLTNSPQPTPPPPQGMTTTEEEQFLGGFTSANLHLKGRGLSSMGYGIYATTKRIIGVNSKKGLIQGVGLILGGVTGLGLILAGRKDSSAKTIAQLEEKKDFEVKKEDISEIEVMKPHGFRAGYLNIELNSGESINVTIADKNEFETIRDMMKAFRPEAEVICIEDASPDALYTTLDRYSKSLEESGRAVRGAVDRILRKERREVPPPPMGEVPPPPPPPEELTE